MNVMKKLREMPRKKLVSNVIILIALVYSISFASIFIGLSLSVFNTLGSINIPDNHFLISLVPEDPSLNVSYSISNKGFSDISSLTIDFKVDICYFELSNSSQREEELFFKCEKIKKINPWQKLKSYIRGGLEYFKIDNLYYFWNHVNLSRPFYYKLDINITGRYCLGIIPFEISVKNLNPDCPTCG